jgi:hypothetical protein
MAGAFDDAAADGARLRVKRISFEQLVALAEADRALQAARSSVKRPSISSTASRLLRNTSRHIVGSEAAMRVKSRKPPAENLITSDRA